MLVSLLAERRGDWRAPRHSQVITSGTWWRGAEWERHREIVARKLGVLDSKRERWTDSCLLFRSGCGRPPDKFFESLIYVCATGYVFSLLDRYRGSGGQLCRM